VIGIGQRILTTAADRFFTDIAVMILGIKVNANGYNTAAVVTFMVSDRGILM
jgi:hypothetical protein